MKKTHRYRLGAGLATLDQLRENLEEMIKRVKQCRPVVRQICTGTAGQAAALAAAGGNAVNVASAVFVSARNAAPLAQKRVLQFSSSFASSRGQRIQRPVRLQRPSFRSCFGQRRNQRSWR